MKLQTVEITQETVERIVNLCDTFLEDEHNDMYWKGVVSGIRRTLTILGVYIEGVNADELSIVSEYEEDEEDVEDNKTS
jgi:hypothetical protein